MSGSTGSRAGRSSSRPTSSGRPRSRRIPLAYALDALTIWQLYVVGFIHGIGTVFFDVSYQSYLPSLVRKEQLVDGNSKLQLSMAASQTAGPASPAC